MLQEIETETIIITPTAANAVRDILAERKLEGFALRVYAAGGSCCGIQFGMALDNITRENDMTFESDGVKVLVDDQSINYLRGARIDFLNDPARGTGFLIDSPNAHKEGGSCGCDSQAETGGGGCGGSCGCGSAN